MAMTALKKGERLGIEKECGCLGLFVFWINVRKRVYRIGVEKHLVPENLMKMETRQIKKSLRQRNTEGKEFLRRPSLGSTEGSTPRPNTRIPMSIGGTTKVQECQKKI